MTNWSKKIAGFTDDVMNISGTKIPIKRGELLHGELRYWQKNPRIYSIVHATDDPLDQDEIQLELQSQEHVKQLFRDIRHHGGLIDPLMVIDNQFDVIEGNSRLAAIRLLCQKDPKLFGKVRCVILPSDISDKVIYSYLHQEHIQGKHQWSPYEQAGVIYRLVQDGGDIKSVSDEHGITARKAQAMYNVYEFMVDHGEDKPSRYSYYEVYLSKNVAKRRRKNEPNLDSRIVEEVNSGKFTAQEFRTMLPHVMEHDKQFNKFVTGKSSMVGSYEHLVDQGKTEDLVKLLKRMHNQVKEMKKEEFDSLDAKAQKDAEYHLKRIITIASNLKKKVYGS